MLRPDFDTFSSYCAHAGLVPVWREFLFDADTAVTAYAKIARPPFGFLLESVEGGERWGRWTFLGTAPREAWRIEPGSRLARWAPEHGWAAAEPCPDPLAALQQRIEAGHPLALPGLPPFTGGAVGYLGYDIVRYLERLPDAPPDDLGLPDAVLIFTDVVLAIDNLFGRAWAITLVDAAGDPRPAELRRRYDDGVARVDDLVTTLAEARPPAPLELRQVAGDPSFESSFSREEFEAGVRHIKEYIAAGDAFQVVLSQRLGLPLEARPFDLYRALRSINPSPYLYFLELDGLSLVGSSPEALVRTGGGRVTLRPIAGTRPRGATEEQDAALAAELLADEKERAEHLMLVDLGRNDAGRVARAGTVRVPEFTAIERYSHVQHLVSRVEAELRDDVKVTDVLRACFPAGTVTGAPKIRAMQIIDELEPVRRGPYAGAIGYIAYGGDRMDAAIAIRTLVITGDRAFVQAGAGVVADSVPELEYSETIAKARALLRLFHAVPPQRHPDPPSTGARMDPPDTAS